jgi:outer membrane protein assembly factor BamB
MSAMTSRRALLFAPSTKHQPPEAQDTMRLFTFFFTAFALLALPSSAEHPGHQVLVQGKNRLAIVEPDGEISWEMPWGGIHDIHVLPNGNILTQRDKMTTICEIDRETKEVVWTYDAAKSNGNEAVERIEVHAIQPLEDGKLLLAESGSGRFVEIDRAGKLVKEIKMTLLNPHPHKDTRLVRKLANGNYLACHEGDGHVREYDGKSGAVVWDFEVPLFNRERANGHGAEAWGNSVFGAIRLQNGNTLIATGNGHSVLEVTPEKEIVWSLTQDELAPIKLAWVTTLEALPNGNYVIGNCHAGPGQPLLIEIDPKTKTVVWTFDRFEDFGNSVPNTLLLDQLGKSIR